MHLPEENLLLFVEKYSPVPEALAARGAAHRAQHRPVLLSAAADPGDERGLRLLRALPHPAAAARGRADRRRRDAGDPAQPHQRPDPARLRRSPLQRHQSLRARLRDDAGHPPGLRGSDRRGPGVVPARSPGSSDWRGVLKDAWANYRDESFIQQFLSPQVMRRLPHVRAGRRRRRAVLHGRRRSTTSAAITPSATRSPGRATSRSPSPTSRSSTSTCSATGS